MRCSSCKPSARARPARAVRHARCNSTAPFFRPSPRAGATAPDADGVIVDVNLAFCAGTGYTREQALGQHARLLRCERQAAGLGDTILRALAIAGSWEGEVAHRYADGSVRMVVEHLTAMPGADGARHCVSRFAPPPGK
ncbi:MAG: PAS domain-containing protein [Massilia sp.]